MADTTTAQRYSLVNARPLIEKTKEFIAQAHGRGDIMLELFLMSVLEQVRQIAERKSIAFFSAKVQSRPTQRTNDKHCVVIVRIVYWSRMPRGGLCRRPTAPFYVFCFDQARETAMSLPLMPGDEIRVVGSIGSSGHSSPMTAQSVFLICTSHIEITKRIDQEKPHVPAAHTDNVETQQAE